MRELHRHFTHGGKPLQSYALAALPFKIFRKNANAILQVAVGLLQCLRCTLETSERDPLIDGIRFRVFSVGGYFFGASIHHAST
jgi:hypothetical protein